MYLRSDEKEIGKENFHAAAGSKLVRRKFLMDAIKAGLSPRNGLGGHYFKYDKSLDKPLAVGVIGTGQQGCRLLGAINPAFITVKAIADLRPSSQKAAIEKLSNANKAKGEKKADDVKKDVRVYDTWQKLLDAAKADGLEAVIIALPSHLHATVSLAAMKAGLHVFTETPMALRVADAKEMARTAKEKKLCLAVGQQRCYSFVYNNAVEMVRKGLLSDVHYIRAQWHLTKDEAKAAKKDANNGDKRVDWWRDVPTEDAALKTKDNGYASVEELVRWQLWEKLSGGMIMELGYHLFDAAAMFVAAMPTRDEQQHFPLSVAASASQLLPDAEGDVDDHVSCVFEYPVKGYVDKGPRKARKKIGLQFDMIVGNEFDGYGETVLGKHGSLVLDREQCGMLYRTSDVDKKIRVVPVKDKDGKPTKDILLDVPKDAAKAGDEESAAVGQLALIGADPGFIAELEHWAWCVRNPSAKNQPRCDAQSGLSATVLAVAAAQAVKHGTRIDFEKEWFDADSKKTPEDDKPEA